MYVYLKPVSHESGGDDVALVVPVVAIGHQEAASDEVLGALLLLPRFP